MRLRDVELGDVDAYVRMRCDPVMTAELGGPLPREGIEAKLARDVRDAAADAAWIKMIIPGEAAPAAVAGSVVLWSHQDGEPLSEIGWMVLAEFQGRGIGKTAVRALLQLARDDGRRGLVHAFPATTNGICRSRLPDGAAMGLDLTRPGFLLPEEVVGGIQRLPRRPVA